MMWSLADPFGKMSLSQSVNKSNHKFIIEKYNNGNINKITIQW